MRGTLGLRDAARIDAVARDEIETELHVRVDPLRRGNWSRRIREDRGAGNDGQGQCPEDDETLSIDLQNASHAIPVPRPAATVMVIRPDPAGIAVYMIRRSSRSRFMPDAYVFPGGAVDPGDGEAPGSFAVAALRELFEEAGMLIACDDRGSASDLEPHAQAALRARCVSGASLIALLGAEGLRLDTRALTYYSNWITPASEPIRFDAHFFVARAPEGQVAVADATEVHDGMWIAPSDALARAERNELTIRFPTQKHLERLARYDDVDAFLEHAASRRVIPVMPIDDGNENIVFPGGADSW